MDEGTDGGGSAFHPSSEFRGKNGKVVYCTECRRMALEYDGYRMVFHRRGSDRLIEHMREYLATPRVEDDTGPIALAGGNDGGCMILSPDEAKEAVELIEMAAILMDAEWPGPLPTTNQEKDQ